MSDTSRYGQRGVSSDKAGVHRAVALAGNDQGIFPGAFCQLFPDIAGDEEYCFTLHADGAGTKFNAAFLAYLMRNKDMSPEAIARLFWGIAQDSIVMNIDDLACVGALEYRISQTINRNRFQVNDDILAALIRGCREFCDRMNQLLIPCHLMPGETADVGDLTRTGVVDNTVAVRMRRDEVIDASRMISGDVIVGFSSTGQAIWETEPNSGIGSNGLTSGRHDLLCSAYRGAECTYSPEMPFGLVYRGPFRLEDPLPGDDRFTIQSALLSPTRTYTPLVKALFDGVPRTTINGLIHCSGGGQTKIGKFGRRGNVYRKYNLLPMPPLFGVIQKASGLPWQEMFQCYNMGHRLEAVVSSMSVAERCVEIALQLGIDARIIGHVDYDASLAEGGERQVVIEAPYLEAPLSYTK